MLIRSAFPTALRLAQGFPVLAITGPRQSGKTTLVVSEWVKRQFNAGQIAELYFWRDNVGHEVDLLIPKGNQFMTVEIKSGSTFSNDWTAALRKLSTLFGDAALPPGIVFGGEGQFEREGCQVVGWRALANY